MLRRTTQGERQTLEHATAQIARRSVCCCWVRALRLPTELSATPTMSNKQRLVLSILEFLNQSIRDGTVKQDDQESLEVASASRSLASARERVS